MQVRIAWKFVKVQHPAYSAKQAMFLAHQKPIALSYFR